MTIGVFPFSQALMVALMIARDVPPWGGPHTIISVDQTLHINSHDDA